MGTGCDELRRCRRTWDGHLILAQSVMISVTLDIPLTDSDLLFLEGRVNFCSVPEDVFLQKLRHENLSSFSDSATF